MFRQDSSLARTENYFYNNKQELVRLVANSYPTETTTVFKYDKSGNKVEEQLTIYNGTVTINLTTFRYDAKNRMIEMYFTRRPDKSTEKRTYKYDANNHMIEQITTSSSGAINRTIYKYDQQLKIIVYTWYSHNTKQSPDKPSITVSNYDKHNNLISNAYDSETAQPDFEYSYDYDSQNNWIRTFIVIAKNKENRASLSAIRTIIYY